MELSVISLIIVIELVLLQLLVIVVLSYCCLTMPFSNKHEHEPSRSV